MLLQGNLGSGSTVSFSRERACAACVVKVRGAFFVLHNCMCIHLHMTAVASLCAKPVLRHTSNLYSIRVNPSLEWGVLPPTNFKPQLFTSPEVLSCLRPQCELSYVTVHVLECNVKHWCLTDLG